MSDAQDGKRVGGDAAAHTRREQIAKQCEVVAHLAKALAAAHADFARIVRLGQLPRIHDMIGIRSAAIMEYLGETLNGMDAATADDEWTSPVFEEARRLFPEATRREG